MFRKVGSLRKLFASPGFTENLRQASNGGSSNFGDHFGSGSGGRTMSLGPDFGGFESGKRRQNVLVEKVVR